MAVTTRLAPSYILKTNLMALVCVVLGVWGIIDYAIWIPAKQANYLKSHQIELIKDALESDPGEDEFVNRLNTAVSSVISEIDGILAEHYAAAGVTPKTINPRENQVWFSVVLKAADPNPVLAVELSPGLEAELREAQTLIETVKANDPDVVGWLNYLLESLVGLSSPRRSGQTLAGPARIAYDHTITLLNEIGNIEKPGQYDRLIKGFVFIPCLPMGLYFWWNLARLARRKYRLEDDGTLVAPGVTLKPDNIADIDMSRWMTKSIAIVHGNEGQQVKLDDFYYKNTETIVGGIAHRFYPDDWTPDARPAKAVLSDVDEDTPADQPADSEDESTTTNPS
jgi:hypothetical protein